MKKIKVAFIGCGNIAHFHADVLNYLGHDIEAVVARRNSKNINAFAKKYSIKEKFYGVGAFINYCKDDKNRIDAILVCTPWNVTESVLKKLLPLNLPVFAEKPAVLSLKSLQEIKRRNTNNLFVAYNRRFYDFIPLVKAIIDKQRPVCVDILSADPYEMILKMKGSVIKRHILHYYTSHVIDLMFYLFKDIGIDNISSFVSGGKISWVCSLYDAKRKTPIQLKVLMDAPENSYLKVYLEKKVLEIKPLEKLMIYDRLNRVYVKGRISYFPSACKRAEADERFKPGFLRQMKYFINNFVLKRNVKKDDFELLEKVTIFCDRLIKNSHIKKGNKP